MAKKNKKITQMPTPNCTINAMTVSKDLASSRKNINGESYAERECERVEPIRVHGNNGPKSHIPGKRNEELTLMQ